MDVRDFASFEQVVGFHGHRCPGLAIGYRMAIAGLSRLDAMRALDEEVVAVVENDACGVDAVQWLAGCTFGKGNLLHLDYGKSVYTLFCRTSGAGIRVVYHPADELSEIADREDRIAWILEAPESDVVRIGPPRIDLPERARIRESVRCSVCGESAMETRIRWIDDEPLCIPCAAERDSS